jgi:hypothetical protein
MLARFVAPDTGELRVDARALSTPASVVSPERLPRVAAPRRR